MQRRLPKAAVLLLLLLVLLMLLLLRWVAVYIRLLLLLLLHVVRVATDHCIVHTSTGIGYVLVTTAAQCWTVHVHVVVVGVVVELLYYTKWVTQSIVVSIIPVLCCAIDQPNAACCGTGGHSGIASRALTASR